MNDPLHPGIATRVRATMRGQRSATALEGLRGAGTGVYQTLAESERARAQLVADGRDRWDAAPQVGGYLVAAWNAFVLQTLAARLLDAELSVPQQFTFDVSGEQLAKGGQFVRRILLGPFTPTTDVDYCDPEGGGHHDD